MRNLLLAMCFAGLWGCSGGTAISEPLALDLTQVQGMQHYDGPESGKKLLQDNGFVVVSSFERRVFVPYFNEDLPHFVTADSVLQTYHVIFEDELKGLETALADEVLALTRDMRKALGRYAAPDQKEALQLALDVFLVAEALLAPPDEAPAVQGKASKEVARIRGESGVSPSPLFGYDMDYTQFKPRSFYVETPLLRRYFQTMTWYGSAGFRQKSPVETRAALIIAHCYVNTPEIKTRWDKINRIYTQLIAPCDDLTPEEYSPFCKDSVPAQPDPAIRTLRNPRINAMVLSPAEMKDWVPLVKGMRFLGFRYMPDSEAFMALTHPKVPGRSMPSGLEVLAANGNKRAGALARKAVGAAGPAYEKGLETAGRVLSTFRKEQPDSQYARFLEVVEALGDDAPRKAPAFAKTSAYADKNTMTGLAAWACMRHAFALHAKDSGMSLCDRQPTRLQGYVEPNPGFFMAMLDLTDSTIALFESMGAGESSRFQGPEGFGALVQSLSAMVGKELAGEAFGEKEVRLLNEYAYRIADLQGFETNTPLGEWLPWLTPIADVHTVFDTGAGAVCLEVAMGGSMPLYVIVEHEGARHLLIGAVSSYYEFAQPIEQRLTDQEWQAAWEGGPKPVLPQWTTSFVAPLDPDALLTRLEKGEEVEEVFSVDDQRIDDFLRAAAQPGSKFDGTEHYGWILEAAARKIGREIAPLLRELMRTGDLSKEARVESEAGATTRTISGKADLAARALMHIIAPEDYPELLQLARNPDWRRESLVHSATYFAEGKDAVAFLLQLLTEPQCENRHPYIVGKLGQMASRDVTPVLLRLLTSRDSRLKESALKALGEIWAAEPLGGARPPYEASETQLKEWEVRLRDIILSELAEKEDGESDSIAMSLAGRMRLAEAVPILTEGIASRQQAGDRGYWVYEAVQTLVRIGTDEAMEVLGSVAATGDAGTREGILQALARCTNFRKAAPWVAEMLSDRTVIQGDDIRICHYAAHILADIYPDGPGNISRETKDMDAIVEKWKVYMEKKLAKPE